MARTPTAEAREALTGHVGLRTIARDAAGNSTDQILTQAYPLRAAN